MVRVCVGHNTYICEGPRCCTRALDRRRAPCVPSPGECAHHMAQLCIRHAAKDRQAAAHGACACICMRSAASAHDETACVSWMPSLGQPAASSSRPHSYGRFLNLLSATQASGIHTMKSKRFTASPAQSTNAASRLATRSRGRFRRSARASRATHPGGGPWVCIRM